MTSPNGHRGTPLSDETVAPGRPWSGVIQRGQVLRITDLEGHQGVDFLCYNAHDYNERYHAPNTLKASHSLRLTTGHTLYSDRARPLFTVTADSCGWHDSIAGCCSAPSNKMLYGVDDCPGCRENFLEALEPYGLGWRDIVPNVNFFCRVPIGPDGRLTEQVFESDASVAGDHVELRAETDALAVISNCPQVNNPCTGGTPTPIQVSLYESADEL